MPQSLRGSFICGRLASHEGFKSLDARQADSLPGPEATHDLRIASGQNAQAVPSHSGSSQVSLDTAQKGLAKFHSANLGPFWPQVKAENGLPVNSASDAMILPMIWQDMIRNALRERGLNEKDASKAAKRAPDWARKVLTAKGARLPRIDAVTRLAVYSGVPMDTFWSAIEREYGAAAIQSRLVGDLAESLAKLPVHELRALLAKLPK